jgi:hypothetical protein
MRMRKRKSYCSGCANLFYLSDRCMPLCVATAEFVNGPLRKRIEVVGVTSAEARNVKNDCGYQSVVSLRAWKVKRWLLWRLNDGSESRIEEADLSRYSVKREHDRKRSIIETGIEEYTKESYDEAQEEVYEYEEDGELVEKEILGAEEGNPFPEEDLLRDDWGDDDNKESGASDQIDDEGIQDAGDSGGLDRKHVHEVESGTND